MLHWLSAVVADLTCAAPPRRDVAEHRDWMPTAMAYMSVTSPSFLAMVDRYAGWYRERHGSETSASRASAE